MLETTPCPVFGAFDESALDWVAVEVAEFFHAFRFAPDVEVVVTFLPEVTFYRIFPQLSGGVLFQHLQGDGEVAAFGFAEEQVEVLGHNDVAGDVEAVPLADFLQSLLECAAGAVSGE